MTQDVFSKTNSEVMGNKGVIAFKVRKIRTLRCYTVMAVNTFYRGRKEAITKLTFSF